MVDKKHTKMANRPRQRLSELAALRTKCDSLQQKCEKTFCEKVDSGDGAYGSQITSETRDTGVYLDLVESAIRVGFNKKRGRDRFDLDHDAPDDVGFDIAKGKGFTKHYKVHGNYEITGPKGRGDAHLFPLDV